MSKVTSKGQVTIPKPIWEELGINPGDEIAFVETERGYTIEKRVEENPFEKWRGSPTPTKVSRSAWPTPAASANEADWLFAFDEGFFSTSFDVELLSVS